MSPLAPVRRGAGVAALVIVTALGTGTGAFAAQGDLPDIETALAPLLPGIDLQGQLVGEVPDPSNLIYDNWTGAPQAMGDSGTTLQILSTSILAIDQNSASMESVLGVVYDQSGLLGPPAPLVPDVHRGLIIDTFRDNDQVIRERAFNPDSLAVPAPTGVNTADDFAALGLPPNAVGLLDEAYGPEAFQQRTSNLAVPGGLFRRWFNQESGTLSCGSPSVHCLDGDPGGSQFNNGFTMVLVRTQEPVCSMPPPYAQEVVFHFNDPNRSAYLGAVVGDFFNRTNDNWVLACEGGVTSGRHHSFDGSSWPTVDGQGYRLVQVGNVVGLVVPAGVAADSYGVSTFMTDGTRQEGGVASHTWPPLNSPLQPYAPPLIVSAEMEQFGLGTLADAESWVDPANIEPPQILDESDGEELTAVPDIEVDAGALEEDGGDADAFGATGGELTGAGTGSSNSDTDRNLVIVGSVAILLGGGYYAGSKLGYFDAGHGVEVEVTEPDIDLGELKIDPTVTYTVTTDLPPYDPTASYTVTTDLPPYDPSVTYTTTLDLPHYDPNQHETPDDHQHTDDD